MSSTLKVAARAMSACIRELNEDRYLVKSESGVFVVADGMGGHDAGEVASTSIVEHLKSIGIPSSAPDLRARFEDRVIMANREIREDLLARNGGDDRLDAGGAARLRAAICLHVGRRQPHLHAAQRKIVAIVARPYRNAGPARPWLADPRGSRRLAAAQRDHARHRRRGRSGARHRAWARSSPTTGS